MPAIIKNGYIYGGGSNEVVASDVEYDNTSSGMTADNVQDAIDELDTVQNNKHKVVSKEVDLQNWTEDTTSQSGTTLYKKTISLSHAYVASPEVDICAATGYILPTTAEQASYDLLQYVTCDSAIPCLYLYASAVPETAFYINVEGVD